MSALSKRLRGWVGEVGDALSADLFAAADALEAAEKALEKVESYLNRVNHVHLLDGSILYASEVFDALAAIRAARGTK